MIIGIGCDIVDHNITKSLGWLSNPRSMQRVFSQKELELSQSQNTNRFISGRFAAKEAVLKCLGTGMKDGISLTEIEILQVRSGAPIVELAGEAKKISATMGINFWHISITHSTTQSIAFAVAECRKE